MKTVIEMAIEAGITPKQMPQPAWVTQWCAVKELERFAELVRADAQRPWVGLTDEEIDDIYQGVGKNDLMLVREVEAKLKEKNGA